MCVVLCSKGYPDKFENNVEIRNLNKLDLNTNEFIYHAGTKSINGKVFSNGGRVMNFSVRSKEFKKSRERALELINKVNWENGFFRKDIGYKVIDWWG